MKLYSEQLSKITYRCFSYFFKDFGLKFITSYVITINIGKNKKDKISNLLKM